MALQLEKDWSLAVPADMKGLRERWLAVLGSDGISDAIPNAVNPVALF